MSTQQTRKDITKELAEAKEQLATLQTKYDEDATVASTLVTDTKAQLVTAQEQVATITAERDTLLIDAEANGKEIVLLKATATEATAKAAADTEEIQSLRAELANPAYTAARKQTLKADEAPAVDQEATTAEDAAKVKAAADAEVEASKGTWAEYHELPEDEKNAYYVANREALLAEQDNDHV